MSLGRDSMMSQALHSPAALKEAAQAAKSPHPFQEQVPGKEKDEN